MYVASIYCFKMVVKLKTMKNNVFCILAHERSHEEALSSEFFFSIITEILGHFIFSTDTVVDHLTHQKCRDLLLLVLMKN